MRLQDRLGIYAQQRNLRGPILDTGIRANIAFWNVGRRITPRQRRRFLKKERIYYFRLKVPF